MSFRKEKDSLGELKAPADAYYGIHSQRSLDNFRISSLRWHPELIRSIAKLKLACAKANNELGFLNKEKSNAIEKACKEIIENKFQNQFPLDILQAKS